MADVKKYIPVLLVKYDFEPGDIFFIMHHDSWLAKVIAWFMDSDFSHSGIILEQTEQRIYTCETSDFQVVYSDLETYLEDDNVSIEVLRLPLVDASAGIDMAHTATQHNQELYGYAQLLFSFSIRALIKKIFKKTIPNFIRQGLVCCELVLYACKSSRIEKLANFDAESIQTQETYELLKSCGAVTIFYKRIAT